MSQIALLERSRQYGATFPPPRPFQHQAHQKLREGALAGHRRQLLMAPTGAGKTYLGLLIVSEALKKGYSALFVCDRKPLIIQTSETADAYGLDHGIIQAKHWRMDLSLPFQIGSVQTLGRRSWPDVDLIIIDEAHTQYSTCSEHIPHCRARVIGLSATPFSQNLGRLYTNLVNAATIAELTEQGILVPMRVYSCTRADMQGAETSGGEWTDRAAAARGMDIVGDVVKEWLEFGENRKTIGFGATIAHCEELCRQFNEAGVLSAVFTSNTTDDERDAILAEYRKPDSAIRVLLSVEALAKGFDVKDVGCIIDARPLRKSFSTFVQMIGRGARSSPETGKTDFILLDFSGNILRFADDFSDLFFNGLDKLDEGEKLDKAIRKEPEDEPEKEPAKCPACGYSPCGKRCVSCGHERRTAALIEHVPGSMQEVRIGKTKIADNRKHLWEQICAYTRSRGNPETASKRAWHLYQEFCGTAPERAWRFSEQPEVAISREIMNRIRHRQIAYAKGTGRG
jgi:DNA repair protein RadD